MADGGDGLLGGHHARDDRQHPRGAAHVVGRKTAGQHQAIEVGAVRCHLVHLLGRLDLQAVLASVLHAGRVDANDNDGRPFLLESDFRVRHLEVLELKVYEYADSLAFQAARHAQSAAAPRWRVGFRTQTCQQGALHREYVQRTFT